MQQRITALRCLFQVFCAVSAFQLYYTADYVHYHGRPPVGRQQSRALIWTATKFATRFFGSLSKPDSEFKTTFISPMSAFSLSIIFQTIWYFGIRWYFAETALRLQEVGRTYQVWIAIQYCEAKKAQSFAVSCFSLKFPAYFAKSTEMLYVFEINQKILHLFPDISVTLRARCSILRVSILKSWVDKLECKVYEYNWNTQSQEHHLLSDLFMLRIPGGAWVRLLIEVLSWAA